MMLVGSYVNHLKRSYFNSFVFDLFIFSIISVDMELTFGLFLFFLPLQDPIRNSGS